MAIEPVGAVNATTPLSAAAASTPASAQAVASGPSFASALNRQIRDPHAAIAQIRAEFASLRNGGGLRLAVQNAANMPPSSASSSPRMDAAESSDASALRAASGTAGTQNAALLAQFKPTGNPGDPYGWRQMSRDIASNVVGPGFGRSSSGRSTRSRASRPTSCWASGGRARAPRASHS